MYSVLGHQFHFLQLCRMAKQLLFSDLTRSRRYLSGAFNKCYYLQTSNMHCKLTRDLIFFFLSNLAVILLRRQLTCALLISSHIKILTWERLDWLTLALPDLTAMVAFVLKARLLFLLFQLWVRSQVLLFMFNSFLQLSWSMLCNLHRLQQLFFYIEGMAIFLAGAGKGRKDKSQ